MKDYKVGDITPNKWEVVGISYNPQYKMRRRIRITTEYFPNLMGLMGYYYFDNHYYWVETDCGKKIKLREDEFEYVDDIKK